MSDDAGTSLLTYAEIAQALGLPSAKAGEAKARRAKWHRTIGNDGFARVAVPLSVLNDPPPTRRASVFISHTQQDTPRPPEGPTPVEAELRRLLTEVQADNVAQREGRAMAEGRAVELVRSLEREVARADRAEAEAARLRYIEVELARAQAEAGLTKALRQGRAALAGWISGQKP